MITQSQRRGNLIVIGNVLRALCPLLSSPGLGIPMAIFLAMEDALGPDSDSGLFSLFLGFVIPGVKISNNKLA